MKTDEAVKLSFHIPASDSHVMEAIQLICDATMTTPSKWVYQTVLRRLKSDGVLDSDLKPVLSAIKTLQDALPPGTKASKANGKLRSSKNS